jgi:hypothetical protein
MASLRIKLFVPILIAILSLALMSAGCSRIPISAPASPTQTSSSITPTNASPTKTVEPTKSPTAEPTTVPTTVPTTTVPTLAPTRKPTPTEKPQYTPCSQTTSGQKTTCMISRAYCSYMQSSKGSPTFCNDRKYPNQDFTFLVWGKDASHLDGRCLIVTGTVKTYKGKLEIAAESLDQLVGYCD